MLLDHVEQNIFAAVETWVFDLDNTLYPPSARLFDQINVQMVDFISRALDVSTAEADRLRRDLWERHGTTMAGLVAEHSIDADHFLAECHRLDLSPLAPDRGLISAIKALKGRRIVHTNGPRVHAEGVLAACGMQGCFEQVITIEDTGYRSKPSAQAFDLAWRKAGLDPLKAAMIEDHAENLSQPNLHGMRTVWLTDGPDAPRPAHVDLRISDLAAFLRVVRS